MDVVIYSRKLCMKFHPGFLLSINATTTASPLYFCFLESLRWPSPPRALPGPSSCGTRRPWVHYRVAYSLVSSCVRKENQAFHHQQQKIAISSKLLITMTYVTDIFVNLLTPSHLRQ